MIRVSASAVPRILACPGSAVLPQHDYTSQYAEAGTARHADQEAAIDTGGAADVLPPLVMEMIGADDKLTTECAFAYDVATDTARELGHGRAAYKGLAPFEIPGCLDLLVMGGGRAIVVDRKSFERVEPAERNGQLLTYALMVARTYGFDEITVVVFYEFGRPDVAVLGPLDLDAHAARLKEMQVEVARAASAPGGALAMGRHCRHCPAFLACPKQHALTLDAGGEMPLRIEAQIPFERDEDAADAFDLLQRIKLLTTRIQAALYARAGERPIPLHSGKVLGPVEKQGSEKLDGDVVYEVVKAQHGQAIADAAVVRSATKKRLAEALKFAGGKGEIAKLERAVLEAVRASGGAKRETKTVIEEHEPLALEVG